jgi:FlaA1/EpsC-like NDP-sugar epimerase
MSMAARSPRRCTTAWPSSSPASAATLLIDVDGIQAGQWSDLATVFAVAVPLQVAVNLLFGVYQGIWRYTSLPDIQRVIFAVLAGTVCISLALRAAGPRQPFDHRQYILYPLFLVGLMSLSRLAVRSFKEWSQYGRGGEQGAPVVIMGAGDAAVGLLKELSRSPEWRVIGLLDDDEKKRGRLLHGVRVVGPLDDLPRFAQRLKVRHAIIAMPTAPYTVRRRVVEICKRARVS